MLKINNVSTDGDTNWIWLSGENNFEEPHKFIKLVREYASQIKGTIKELSKNSQWIIDNDPLELIFQCDDCFGITIVVPKKIDVATAKKVLEKVCEVINN